MAIRMLRAHGVRAKLPSHQALATIGVAHGRRPRRHLRITAHRLRHHLHRVGRVNRARRLSLHRLRTLEA